MTKNILEPDLHLGATFGNTNEYVFIGQQMYPYIKVNWCLSVCTDGSH